MTKRLLISYAHPDDESFGNGGLIAKYVAEGAEVYLICATDGDMGTIPEDMQDDYDTVRELRLSELDCASEVLGFKKVFKFGYKDSGMMGADSTNDPDCLWYQWQHHSEDVTRRVVEVIREVQPHVILTFNEYGGYGHPDHIAIQRATCAAFERAGDATYLTDGQQPYQPQKLYYSSIPGTLLKMMLFWLRLRGKDPRRMGVNEDINFEAVVDHIEPTHTKVSVREYLEIWDKASACHKSQGGGSAFMRLPMWIRRLLMGTQGFTRVHPVPERDRVDEHDLFEGVRVTDRTSETLS
jgi:LmbE family N-acetylglucosaminyl deacetylase